MKRDAQSAIGDNFLPNASESPEKAAVQNNRPAGQNHLYTLFSGQTIAMAKHSEYQRAEWYSQTFSKLDFRSDAISELSTAVSRWATVRETVWLDVTAALKAQSDLKIWLSATERKPSAGQDVRNAYIAAFFERQAAEVAARKFITAAKERFGSKIKAIANGSEAGQAYVWLFTEDINVDLMREIYSLQFQIEDEGSPTLQVHVKPVQGRDIQTLAPHGATLVLL